MLTTRPPKPSSSAQNKYLSLRPQILKDKTHERSKPVGDKLASTFFGTEPLGDEECVLSGE